jgi:hypothetical protein
MQDPVLITGIISMSYPCWSCSRDATTARITNTYGGGCEELIVASAYLPYDSDEPPPTTEVRDINGYCYSRKKQLIIGCDANAHNTL